MQMRKLVQLMVAGTLVFCGTAVGQEKTPQTSARFTGYDVKRESTLVAAVIAYTTSSTTAPSGAHVTLQTAGGVVDVHLGDARLLDAGHISIQTGDTLRIIGENVTFAGTTHFLARIVQKGT